MWETVVPIPRPASANTVRSPELLVDGSPSVQSLAQNRRAAHRPRDSETLVWF